MKKKSGNASRHGNDRHDLRVPPMTREEMRRGVIGKYSDSVPPRLVALDPDVAKVFRDSESVNRVLRAIAENMPERRRRRVA